MLMTEVKEMFRFKEASESAEVHLAECREHSLNFSP